MAQDKISLDSERDQVSYAMGMDVANSFQPVAPFLDLAAFERGLKQIFAGGKPTLPEAEVKAVDAALRENIAASQGVPMPGKPPGSQPAAVDKTKVGLMLAERVVAPSLAPLKDDIDLPVLIQAMRSSFAKQPMLLTPVQAQAAMEAYTTRKHSELGAKNRSEGAAFLSENKNRKGVITTPSGLQYMVLRQGNGPRPTAGSKVRVNYEGKLLDGSVFDSSYARGTPADFPLNSVIAGWTEGLQLMPVGAKYRFWIPSSLAYGENGNPGIGPDAMLTFDVELINIL
nr:FKBP-type peptidyl-prolyl cis-trans isomerase [Pseudoxanthomonas kalamensis]